MDELGNETGHPGHAAVVVGLAMLAIGAPTIGSALAAEAIPGSQYSTLLLRASSLPHR